MELIVKRGLVLKKSGVNTFKVLIKFKVVHAKYKKILTRFKKVLVHDGLGCCRPGLNILIKKTKPISRLKN
jgi:small subunit ribosomal protein S17